MLSLSMSSLEENVSYLGRVPMFGSMSPGELEALGEIMESVRLERGGLLFGKGDFGEALFVLVHGVLGISFEDNFSPATGAYDTTMEPWEILGEMTCIDPAPRSASVWAISDQARLLVLHRSAMFHIRSVLPDLFASLIRCIWGRVSSRLRVTNEAIGLYGSANGPAQYGFGSAERQPKSFKGQVDFGSYEAFEGFSSGELEILQGLAKKRQYPDGAIVCYEGDRADRCFVVMHGEAVVYRELGKKRYDLGTLEPGDIFGQLSLIEPRGRSANIRAQGDLVVVEIAREDFDRLIQNRTPFGLRFQELVAIAGIRQLRGANDRYHVR